MPEVKKSELSEEQRAVVQADDRFMVVLASAGSGKTEVVAQRVERLLSESSDNFKVVALSYTRRAAAELRSRFAERLVDKRRRVDTDTLHGFAQRLLIQYGTWIGIPADPLILTDDADRVDLLQTWLTDAGRDPLVDARTQLLELDSCLARGEVHELAEDWSRALADAGALDYGAMLTRATDLLEIEGIGQLVARIYKHVIVDEAQNLTFAQYRFLERLFRCSESVSAVLVGDDKQSIVGFAGASVEYLRSFQRDFGARAYRLTCNFRSAAVIARLANAIAENLRERPSPPQEYAAEGLIERAVFADEETEANGIAVWVHQLLEHGMPTRAISSGESNHLTGRDIAVLARSASALRPTENALLAAGFSVAKATHADDWLMSDLGRQGWMVGTFRPQSAVSQRRLSRELGISASASVADVKATLQARGDGLLAQLVGHEDPTGFMQTVSVLNGEEEGWHQDQRELTAAWADFCNLNPVSSRTWPQFELFVAQWQRGDDEQEGIRLQTVHKSQGREFKAVAIIGLNDGQFPDFRARSAQSRESELRAFYVAATRASRCLYLTRPQKVLTRNGWWERHESPFLRIG